MRSSAGRGSAETETPAASDATTMTDARNPILAGSPDANFLCTSRNRDAQNRKLNPVTGPWMIAFIPSCLEPAPCE